MSCAASGVSVGTVVHQWLRWNSGSLRIVKLLALFKPTVLCVLNSEVASVSVVNIPVVDSLACWRWMWIGDGLCTLLSDGCQIGLSLWLCYRNGVPLTETGVSVAARFSHLFSAVCLSGDI